MSRTILIIKLGALGDIFLSFEAFQALRRHHSGDRIVLLTRASFAALTKRMPWFDDVWVDTGPKFWQPLRCLAWRRRMRDGGFDRIYDLQGNDRTRFYFHLLGGRRGKAEWCGPVKGCAYPSKDLRHEPVHAAERGLRYIAAAGVAPAGPADMSWLTGPVDGLGLPPRYVVLVPGCAPHRLCKRWPATRYAELARRLPARGLGVVVVGTAADRESIDTICREAPGVVDLCGKTDIGQLVEVARRATGIVGNDTGPVHMAAAAGTPTLMLMCKETDPVRSLPRGAGMGYLRRPSLDELQVDEVEAALCLRTEA